MQDNLYTFKFMTLVCLACAIVVSAAATGLKSFQDQNQKIDVQRNILRVMGLADPEEHLSGKDVSSRYNEMVKCIIVDQNGNVIEEDADPTTINLEEQDGQVLEAKKRNASLDELSLKYPVFVTPREQPFQAYCIPIYGKGLWSTLYGYLALESDANTVRGITFYKHGETPGLGAEIENPNWQKEFVGKKILDDQGELVSIEVVKGRAPEESLHQVDGLSGATITSRGVQTLVKDALTKYRPYFEQIWKQKGS